VPWCSDATAVDRSKTLNPPFLLQARRFVSPHGWGGALALVVDQLSKLYAEKSHLLHPPVPTMAHHRASSETAWLWVSDSGNSYFAFHVTHVANAGIMMGALENAAPPIPWLMFMATTVIGLAMGIGLLAIAKQSEKGLLWGAVLLTAGVASNLMDRLRVDYVVDWAHLQWRLGGWLVDAPAFNLADLFIIAGSALASIALIRRKLPLAHVHQSQIKQG